jgi:cell division protein FtsL
MVVTPSTGDPLTRSEARRFTASALMAVLLIGTVFSATWIIFTLFLTKIMFR